MYLTKERKVRKMVKVKGIKKLNKAICAAFADFGITGMRLTDDYGYYLNDGTIDYRLTEGHIEDIWFNEFIKERFGYNVKNTFMISILHEIGHHMTLADIYENNFVYDFCIKEKKKITKKMKKAGKKKAKELEWRYFNLPDEIAATAWAIDYAKKNKKELKKVWENVQAALLDFYNKNITEEG